MEIRNNVSMGYLANLKNPIDKMKSSFLSKQAKILVDISLVIGFVLLMFAGHIGEISGSYWTSLHCIMGGVWSLLMILHVAQHWRLVKAFTKKKVVLKNKITALTTYCLILMLISISSFIVGMPLTKFHNAIGHVFILIIIIHTIDKSKRFISLFKTN